MCPSKISCEQGKRRMTERAERDDMEGGDNRLPAGMHTVAT